jgi:hypothetical protein
LRRIRVCLALITALCLLQMAALAKPSVVETDKSHNDLDELEALLTGQHPGSSFAGDGALYKSSRPGPNLTPVMDLPYMAAFWNDTIFGSFIREWEAPQFNQTYENGTFNSPIWSSISSVGEAGTISHRRKPILLTSKLDF